MDSTTVIAMIGLVLAAGFWIITQLNVLGVGKKIHKFQEEAREHADQLIAEKFKEVDAKISLITQQIPKMDYQKIQEMMPDIPEFPEMPDLEALRGAILSDLNAQLNAAIPIISKEVQEAVKNEYRTIKGKETMALGKALEPYGVGISEAGETIRAEITAAAQEGMDPMQLAAMQLMQRKPSPAWIDENPGAAMFLDLTKMFAAQYISGGGNGTNQVGFPQTGKNSKKALSSGNQDKSGIFG